MKTTYGITKGELAAARKYLDNDAHMIFDRALRWGYVMQQLKLTYMTRRLMVPYGGGRKPLVLQ